MRKLTVLFISLMVFISSTMVVMAEPLIKTSDAELISEKSIVNVGESITLTARTVKKGSSYLDEWEGAIKNETILLDENYVSTAEFFAEAPGTYTITYTMTMNAGRSDVLFTIIETSIIEVVSPVISVVGADITNLRITPVMATDGSISGYSVLADIYILWSDGTSTPYGSISFSFGPEETSRVLNVSFNIDGNRYSYPVTVTR